MSLVNDDGIDSGVIDLHNIKGAIDAIGSRYRIVQRRRLGRLQTRLGRCPSVECAYPGEKGHRRWRGQPINGTTQNDSAHNLFLLGAHLREIDVTNYIRDQLLQSFIDAVRASGCSTGLR